MSQDEVELKKGTFPLNSTHLHQLNSTHTNTYNMSLKPPCTIRLKKICKFQRDSQ